LASPPPSLAQVLLDRASVPSDGCVYGLEESWPTKRLKDDVEGAVADIEILCATRKDDLLLLQIRIFTVHFEDPSGEDERIGDTAEGDAELVDDAEKDCRQIIFVIDDLGDCLNPLL
jgi:hypothetical protein